MYRRSYLLWSPVIVSGIVVVYGMLVALVLVVAAGSSTAEVVVAEVY